MTAGKGIMHAEMPRQNADGSPTVGMQLWVDLPEKLKMCEPRYRDLAASDVPTIEIDDKKVEIKIISGQSHGTDSVKELAYTPVWIFDITIRPGGKVSQPLPTGWNAFAYTLQGSTLFASSTSSPNETKTKVEKHHTVEFEQKGDLVSAEVPESAKESGRFSKLHLCGYMDKLKKKKKPPFLTMTTFLTVLIAGLPLDQKVVQYGPFVLSSQEQVYQAMLDYQSHSNGFERAKGWQSEIGKPLLG